MKFSARASKSASLLATTSWVAIALFADQANAGCTPASAGNDIVLCDAATLPDPEASQHRTARCRFPRLPGCIRHSPGRRRERWQPTMSSRAAMRISMPWQKTSSTSLLNRQASLSLRNYQCPNSAIMQLWMLIFDAYQHASLRLCHPCLLYTSDAADE